MMHFTIIRIAKCVILLALFSFLNTSVSAQQLAFEADSKDLKHPNLDDQFTAYEVIALDASTIWQRMDNDPQLQLDVKLSEQMHWQAKMFETGIARNYKLRVATENGIVEQLPASILALRGYPKSGGTLTLTLADDFFYAYYQLPGGDAFYVEPLYQFVPEAAPDEYVMYYAKDVVPYKGKFCAADMLEENKHLLEQKHDHEHVHAEPEAMALPGQCLEVELAIASDFSMFQKKGGIAGVEAFTVGVINNVQTNYDDEFDDELLYVIVEQFVSTCSTCDPWTASVDPGILLPDFRGWANGGGFAATHDMGELWTNRDFLGQTIGLAYVGTVCGFSRYHILQDFSNNAQQLRVLTAHEMGHNWSCTHDDSGSPFKIMRSILTVSDVWGPQSEGQVNSFVPTRNCLSICQPQNATADFSTLYPVNCPGAEIEFFNESTNYTSLSWSFPGGNPSFSSDENPIVTYNNPGSYSVSLTASNGSGSNTINKNIIVDVVNGEETFFREDFENGLGAWTVTNPDNSVTWQTTTVNGTKTGTQAAFMDHYNYFSFGEIDGLESPVLDFSNRMNLRVSFEHAYARSFGNFSERLRLYVSTDGGATFPFQVLEATENGGGSLATRFLSPVQFTPSIEDDWCFGLDFGANCFEVDLNPFAGEQNVVLRFEMRNANENNFYLDNIRVAGSCFLVPLPEADFVASDTVVCPQEGVQFTDISTGGPATDWFWEFEGGVPPTSTNENPLVFYPNPGLFDVRLSVLNETGESSLLKEDYILVLEDPVADFSCTSDSLTVTFTNESTNATDYLWRFGDGNTSTDTLPVHTYDAPGTYEIELIVSNECGSDFERKTIKIVIPPIAGFTADTTIGCVPLTVQFADTSQNLPDSVIWYFSGGEPDTVINVDSPMVTYNAAGVYLVQMIVINDAGMDTLIDSTYIQVLDTTNADFSYTVFQDSAFFTNTSTGYDSIQWYFGDGDSSQLDTVTHVYAESNDYDVMLIAYGPCGTDTVVKTVTIQIGPRADFEASPPEACDSLTTTFTNTSYGDSLTWQWFFAGGTPSSSTDTSPVVTYDSIGFYDVTLIVSNNEGNDTLTRVGYIVVKDTAIADFSWLADTLDVQFTNLSIYADSVRWDFGDGQSSTEENPLHSYAIDSFYTVQLIAYGECGNDTITKVVTAGTLPVAGFDIFNEFDGCAPLLYEFTNLSSANTRSWEWAFEGGDPMMSTDTNPDVTYNSGGIFDVQLIVSNALGSDTLRYTDTIVINGLPTADFTANQISGLTVQFTNTSVDADSVYWKLGDGTETSEANPQHTYLAQGLYTVTLYAFNDCGIDTLVREILFVLDPIALFTADPINGCAPQIVQFTDTSINNPLSWFWQFEGGDPAISTDPNPQVTYNSAGTYDVSLIITNSIGADTIVKQDYISIGLFAAAGFTQTITDLTVDFTDASANADSICWFFGDGNTSKVTNPSYTYTDPGTYTVTQVVFNGCGSDTARTDITLIIPPVAGFTSDMQEGCIPQTIQFSDTSLYMPSAWEWFFEGGTPASSTDQNPAVVYNTAGTFDVQLIVSNSAGADTILFDDYISIGEPPTADFSFSTAGLTADFTDASTGADSVRWDFGDSNGSSATNPSHTYTAQGTYTVTQIAINACGRDTIEKEVQVLLTPIAAFDVSLRQGCVPEAIQFTDLSTNSPTAWEWRFEGGTPATSNDPNPNVTYANAGLFDVTLIVTNSVGRDTLTLTDYIEINNFPVANFTANVNNRNVSFTNLSQFGDTYIWRFGDGNTSTTFDPTYDYGSDDFFSVTLVVINDCGADSVTQQVRVGELPIAGFDISDVQGCLPHQVTFTNTSTANTTSIRWDFEGGSPANATTDVVNVSYANEGTFDVRLIAENALGADTLIIDQAINVLDVPTAGFSFTRNGLDIQFTDQSIGADNVRWFFGDSNESIIPSPLHTYANEGVYFVTQIVNNVCGSDTAQQSLQLVNLPVANFSAAVNPPICIGDTIQYSSSATGLVDVYDWTFEGGSPASSALENPAVVYNAAGLFDVSLRVTNIAGEDAFSINDFIRVLEAPTADFSFSQNGRSITFTNASQGATSFSWDFGDNTNSGAANPTHTYDNTGTFTVTLEASNGCGIVSISKTIEIIERPIAVFDLDKDGGCMPLEVQFEGINADANTTHKWFFEGGNPGFSNDASPLVVYPIVGDYDVTYIVFNKAGADTMFIPDMITVEPRPFADFSFDVLTGDTAFFFNESTDATTYEWDFGDGNKSDEPSPTHVYDESGLYNITLIATNDCGSDTLFRGITVVITSTEDIPIGVDFLALYPNPNDGLFMLDMGSTAADRPSNISLQLYNIYGQRLDYREADFRSGQLKEVFDMPALPSGTYLLQIGYQQERVWRKIVISK